MGNVSNNAYALTVLSPIKDGHIGQVAFSDDMRQQLVNWALDENSPMARVPNTYLCRYFILDDVYIQSLAGGDFFGTLYDALSIFSDTFRRNALPKQDHLQSAYLVFCCNLHGDLDTYLEGMWLGMQNEIKALWKNCYAFDQVNDAKTFIAYIKKCQLDSSLFFVGSTDDSLQEQLKSLYVKQEFSRFAAEHQGFPAADLQREYKKFISTINPTNLTHPSWVPGKSTI